MFSHTKHSTIDWGDCFGIKSTTDSRQQAKLINMENDERALMLLRQIVRAIDYHAKQISKDSGLTGPQLILLQSIQNNGELTVGELAKDVNLTQATVTSILDRLEKKQLVRRERSLQDKRRVIVSLTDQGFDLLKSSPAPLQLLFQRQFNDMRSWEQSMLISSLERVAHMLDGEHLDASPILTVGEIDKAG